MNRKYMIAGNWKMNPEGDPLPLLKSMRESLSGIQGVDLLIAPPFTGIHQAVYTFKGSGIYTAGQNLFWEEKGAYTGEISASQLKAAGASHVIIGHSERRQYFGETDETVNKRTKTAIKNGLIPIVCIGETGDERAKGITATVIERQFEGAFADISAEEADGILIAYEPVWAIGTGKVATPSDAQEVHSQVRQLLVNRYSAEFSDRTRILYGGSMKPDNAEGLLSQPDIDGGLIGGASLTAESFAGIAKAALKLI